jgi:hypothetical protein
VGFVGVFHGLPGKLVPGFVVFFAVVGGCYTVGLCGEIMELRGSLMRIFWHALSPEE